MFVFAFMLNLKLPHVLLIFGFMPIQQTALLTLFGPGFFWSVVPLDRRGEGGEASNVRLHFLKTIKDVDMKLTSLIRRREINLLLLSYLSCDVT